MRPVLKKKTINCVAILFPDLHKTTSKAQFLLEGSLRTPLSAEDERITLGSNYKEVQSIGPRRITYLRCDTHEDGPGRSICYNLEK